jgi:hypothetical protein
LDKTEAGRAEERVWWGQNSAECTGHWRSDTPAIAPADWAAQARAGVAAQHEHGAVAEVLWHRSPRRPLLPPLLLLPLPPQLPFPLQPQLLPLVLPPLLLLL